MKKPYIYVASSWRNQDHPAVVGELRAHGFDVYDFRNPSPGDNGFHWSEIDPDWKSWTSEKHIGSLGHPIAQRGFGKDLAAMVRADACVLVLPCGRSAHLEAGWFVGAGKPTFIFLGDLVEPELMYKLSSGVFADLSEIIEALNRTFSEKTKDAGDG